MNVKHLGRLKVNAGSAAWEEGVLASNEHDFEPSSAYPSSENGEIPSHRITLFSPFSRFSPIFSFNNVDAALRVRVTSVSVLYLLTVVLIVHLLAYVSLGSVT